MAETKDYVWLFPTIAGILVFITLFTPAGSMNLFGIFTANLWIWDLYVYDYSGLVVGSEFITDPLIMIPSFITTGLLAISGTLIIIFGVLLKRNKDLRKIVVPSILLGALFIISEIIWLTIVPLNFPLEDYLGPAPPGYTYTFWSMSYMGITVTLHNIGFGVVGGFLAAILAFSGAGAAYYYSKKPKVTIQDEIETKTSVETKIPLEVAKLKYCPNCGVEIDDLSLKFCGICGYKLERNTLK